MNARELNIFLHLCSSLHFSRTSVECFISPSSLTRLVQRLEAEVGAVLFERDNRTVKLTPAGEIFREYAQLSLSEWEALCSRLQSSATALSGHLSVFCSVTASYYFLQDLLDQFRQHSPDVTIQLHTGDTALTIQRILDEQEDFGVAARPDKLPAKMRFKAIGQSPLVFIAPLTVCPLRSRLNDWRRHSPELPWQEVPFILSETGLARERVNSWFRERGIKPEIYAQLTGNEAIVSMVSLGFGVGVVPRLVVENSPLRTKVEVLTVETALEPFTIGVCTLNRKLSNPLIRAFWDLAGAEA